MTVPELLVICEEKNAMLSAENVAFLEDNMDLHAENERLQRIQDVQVAPMRQLEIQLRSIQTVLNFTMGLEDWRSRANARLFAAAPDLLAVCKSIVQWDEDCQVDANYVDALDDIIDSACVAIAKAEAE